MQITLEEAEGWLQVGDDLGPDEDAVILCFPPAAAPRPDKSFDHLEKTLQDRELTLGLGLS